MIKNYFTIWKYPRVAIFDDPLTFSVVFGNIDLLNNKSAISTCTSDNDGSSTSLVYCS